MICNNQNFNNWHKYPFAILKIIKKTTKGEINSMKIRFTGQFMQTNNRFPFGPAKKWAGLSTLTLNQNGFTQWP